MLPKSMSSTASFIPQARPKRRILTKEEQIEMIKVRFNLSHGTGKRKKKKKRKG